MIQENEIPKYLKPTGSNISKSNRKSKHKHHYEECLIQYRSTFIGKTHLNTGLYTYCTICGKINERFKENKSIVKDYIRTVDTSIGKCYSRISDEELYEKYHNKLPIFFVEDIYKEIWVETLFLCLCWCCDVYLIGTFPVSPQGLSVIPAFYLARL